MVIRLGRGFAAFYRRIQERYGAALQADRSIIQQFWTMTGQAIRAANRIIRGQPPSLNSIPIMPGELTNQRFRVQGIVRIKAPGLGEPNKPLEADLPFVQDSPNVPTLQEINLQIEDAFGDGILPQDTQTPRGRKDRERASYIRNRGEPIEYDIAPLFVWRTS